MVKLKNLIYALSLAPLIWNGCNSIKSFEKGPVKEPIKILMPYPEIYDTLSNRFIEKSGGINEKIINENLEYLNKNEFWKYRIVDSVENSCQFRNLKENEGSLSEIKSMIIMTKNFKILNEIDKTEIKKLDKEFIPLKSLMEKLDSIQAKKPDLNYKSLKEIYETIGKTIKPSYDSTDLFIHDVVAGKGGVCRDLVSTYYPLLTYYGFDIGFYSGGVEEDTSSSLHTWLYAKLEKEEFDLDPTWYKTMIPLEERLKGADYWTLKEKYILRKKN